MIDILFYIVVHDPQIWVKVDVLKKLGTDHSFALVSCFNEVGVSLSKLPAEHKNLRTLHPCHEVSNVLKNIQLARGVQVSKFGDNIVYISDIKTKESGRALLKKPS